MKYYLGTPQLVVTKGYFAQKERERLPAWEDQPEHSFKESCCDGGACGVEESASYCGCDMGCKPEPHYCAYHKELMGHALPVDAIDTTERYVEIPRIAHHIGGGQVTVQVGAGGAPTRATTLPETAAERKKYPVGTGVLDYFPDALLEVARCSYEGNEQHNPGMPLHWDRSKSDDEDDAMIRHFMQRGTRDKDGVRHSAKMAWRALAYLQKEIEGEDQKR